MSEVIQGLWIGSELSPLESLCVRSFVHQGHRFELYAYGDVANVPAGVCRRDAREIIPEEEVFASHNGSYAMFADKFRYKLLYECGGYWVDLDVYCLKPFRFDAETIIATELTQDGSAVANNGIIKAPKGSELMRCCYEVCCSLDIATMPWGATGPYLMGEMTKELGLNSCTVRPEVFNPIPWWDVGRLVLPTMPTSEPDALPFDLQHSSAVHFWNNMWKQCSLDKWAAYPNSLYERLGAALCELETGFVN